MRLRGLLAGGLLLLAGRALADMFPDASNAKLPEARRNLGIVASVRDYGATGDGVTDDGPALARALVACGALSPLYVPGGTYRTRQQLYAPPNCRGFGDAAGVNYLVAGSFSSQIVADNTDGAFTGGSFTASISGTTMTVTASSGSPIGLGNHVAGVGVNGYTFVTAYGTGTGGTGTYTVSQSQSVSSEAMTGVGAVLTLDRRAALENVYVHGDNVAGHADAIDIIASEVALNHVTASAAGTYGVHCKAGGQIVTIKDSIIGGSLSDGVMMRCADSAVSNSYLKYNSGVGVYVNAAHVRIIGNKIEGSTYGVDVINNYDTIISGNDIADNTLSGVYLQGSGVSTKNVVIAGNAFDDNGIAKTAGADCHIRFSGTITNLSVSGNTFSTGLGGAGATSVPNYVWCGTATPSLAGSMVSDAPGSQAIGVYSDAATQDAVQAAAYGLKYNNATVGPVVALCHAAPLTSAGNDTTEDVLATCNVPANVMGLNGKLRIKATFTASGAGGARAPRLRYSGASGSVLQVMSSTDVSIILDAVVSNTNNKAVQQFSGSVTRTAGASVNTAAGTAAVNTANASSVVISCQKVSATDVCTLVDYTVELVSDGM